MRFASAFLLPRGLESKEFRFGFLSAFACYAESVRKGKHYFVISKYFYVNSLKNNSFDKK